MIQAVVLAGGKGTRLSERLGGRPKPLVDVLGKPLLQRQIEVLKAQGIERFLLLVNHRAEAIEQFLRSNGNFGCDVVTIDDGEPRGTAGATLAAFDRLDDRFLVVYGDTLFDIDVAAMRDHHAGQGADATLFLHPNDHPHDSDIVELDQSDRVTAFHPYPHPEGAILPNQVNGAFYIVERSSIAPWRGAEGMFDFGKHLFPAMLGAGAKLAGYRSFEYIKDCGTPKRLDKVEGHLRAGIVEGARRDRPQACVFVDRDGTLNELRGYIRSPEELSLLPGAGQAVRRLNELQYRVIVVTNQPVIARGEVDEAGLRRIHAKLETELGASGAFVDRIFHCPHHPDKGFPGEVAALKIACDCRKPGIGLLERAEMLVDRQRSWMIGDSSADIAAAEAFGVRSILVRTGEGGADGKCAAEPDFTFDDISDAVAFIETGYSRVAAALDDLIGAVGPGDLVLIGGLARSGKSTAAAVLRHELNRRGHVAVTVPLDRWILPAEARSEGVLGRFDMAAALDLMRPWLDGESAEVETPFYNRYARTRREKGKTLCLDVNGVAVLDGVTALAAPFPTGRRVHRVYIQADEERRAERVVKDLRARDGSTTQQARALYLARQMDEASVVTAGAASAAYRFCLDDIVGFGGKSQP